MTNIGIWAGEFHILPARPKNPLRIAFIENSTSMIVTESVCLAIRAGRLQDLLAQSHILPALGRPAMFNGEPSSDVIYNRIYATYRYVHIK